MNQDLFRQLAPAHAPPPPGWWPPAPGWWLLTLCVLVLAAAVFGLWKWHRGSGRRLRRLALGELRRIERSEGGNARLAQELELLLRRYAVARYGREAVAALSGDRWIAFVAAHGGDALAGDSGRALLRGAYGGSVTDRECAGWLPGARGFLRART